MAECHHSYGSYAPSTYGSYEPRRANPSTGAVQCRGLIHRVFCAVLCENREKEDSEATHMRERKKEAAKLEVSQQPCTPCHAPMASCGLIHRV